MNIKKSLRELNLGCENSVVIGSGILNAYKIRQSNDIDIVVPYKEYSRLASNKKFIEKNKHGSRILTFDIFEVGTYWEVLGKKQTFNDLCARSLIIDSVRYISLDFLLAVKKSWQNKNDARQKDIDDIALIEEYMRENLI